MTDWHHAPVHRLGIETTFFITGGTHLKQHFYETAAALDELKDVLFEHIAVQACALQAWVLLSNHYHLVIRAPTGEQIRNMLTQFHSHAARLLNRRDRVRARRVWFQYWDKTLTFEGSWLARIRYTHENAVHHGIVNDARKYRWCSAAAFEASAPRKFVDAVSRVKIDSIKVYDPF
jgi:putative transposase